MNDFDWNNFRQVRHSSHNEPMSIATAIIAAAVILIGGWIGYQEWEKYQAKRDIEIAAQQALAIMQEATVQRQTEAEMQEKRRLIEAEQQKADWARQIAYQEQAAQLQKAHDAAWGKYYKPYGSLCNNPPNDSYMTECANSHMRQMKEFEAHWNTSIHQQ